MLLRIFHSSFLGKSTYICTLIQVTLRIQINPQVASTNLRELTTNPQNSVCFIDIIFILDSSESAKGILYDKQKEFAILLSDKLFLMKPTRAQRYDIRLAIILKVEVVSTLQQFPTKDSLKNAVDAMQYYGEGTYTATAISKAIDIFQMARQGVRKVAVVITDGQADQREPHKLEVVVRDAHAVNIEIFVIGVVQKTDPNFENFRKEMDLIATDPDSDHVYQIDDFMTLQGKNDVQESTS
uniref:VWFA domain-containing protein n=1 Tax=Pseudonaja textilis TaxID=8673 RepID=A0A670Z777_PSETE